MAPIIIMQLPVKIDQRRPNFCAKYGTKGSEQIAPRLYMAAIRPLMVGWSLGSLKS
jgi:hypothetical protein